MDAGVHGWEAASGYAAGGFIGGDGMKQVLQQPGTGEIRVAEVPAPQVQPGCVLVRVAASVLSAGTERASAEFAGKNLMAKAKARPDLVREVLNKARRDGLAATVTTVRNRLEQPGTPGYSSAGRVIEVGEGVVDINVNDRVSCAGAGYAVHAEAVCVPRLLVAKFPEEGTISFEEGAFATLGAVTLHGIRLSEAKLGDVVAVIGLGLLGQIAVQMLKSAGCRVVGMDINPDRARLAARLGADAVSNAGPEFHETCRLHSRGRGADAVLITAETASSEPVNLAAEVSRDRAIVTAVGTVGMAIERKLYYEKELDFRVSRSYGPGRYDTAYEQKGRDYPVGYVRWTETRNMDAFLRLVGERKLDLGALITHRFPIQTAASAYELIMGRRNEPFLGVLITYSQDGPLDSTVRLVPRAAQPAAGKARIGMLGAGNFAVGTLMPAMRAAGCELVSVCSATGAKSRAAAEKHGFRSCTSVEHALLHDPEINTIVIATRHHLHARQTVEALRAGRHVFCEKPLCLCEEELAEIVRAAGDGRHQLMVGFNRRFAPLAARMKQFLQTGEPLIMQYRVNAGLLPADHWSQDPEQGGGRIKGEVCHFLDFLTHLCGSLPVEVQTRAMANPGKYSDDNVVIAVQFANGSQGTITYVANGDKSYSKERIEAFGGGRVAVLEDFRELELVRDGRRQRVRSRMGQDKGHQNECKLFAKAVEEGGGAPIPLEEMVGVALATLRAAESRLSGKAMPVATLSFIEAARTAASAEYNPE
jgi:predicted dehydrogenase